MEPLEESRRVGSAPTELEELSAALERREAMLSQAESISKIGSWEWEPDSGELHWSDQMFRIYGVEQSSFVPTIDGVREFYVAEDRDHVRTLMNTALATRQPFHFEYRIAQPSGDVRVLQAWGRAEAGKARRLFGVVQDITERKETERVLADALSRERILRAGVERASAELEDFVYTVSHDLNGPLISILGYVDLLEGDFGTSIPDDGKFYLERVKVSGKFMQALINDLLELSRVGRVQTEPEVVDLHAVIHEIADEIRADAPEAKVNVGSLPLIYLNPVRAKQLFANLIENSIKHGDRSDISITVSAGPATNGLVPVSVADDGPGIPLVQREKVFGVFERLDPSRSGTGMGLALCRRIVETNGGLISIADSETGTIVRLSLPACETEGSAS